MASLSPARARRTPVRRAALRLEPLDQRIVPAFTPLTAPFQVNASSALADGAQDSAIAADGRSVVVWAKSTTVSGSVPYSSATYSNVYARLIDPQGNPVGADILVNQEYQYATPPATANTSAYRTASEPTVGVDAAGNFVVAWTYAGATIDGAGTYLTKRDQSVNLRRFAAGGTPLAGDQLVEGSLAWYTPNPNPPPPPPAVPRGTIEPAGYTAAWSPDLAVSANGTVALAYAARPNFPVPVLPADNADVRLWRSATNSIVKVETFNGQPGVTTWQNYPGVAVNDAGAALVAWTSTGQLLPGNNNGELNVSVYAQAFIAAGPKTGSEVRLTDGVSPRQADPSVALNNAGQAVVTWGSDLMAATTGLYGQRFSVPAAGGGGKAGTNFRIDTAETATGLQFGAGNVGMDAAGNFLVAWTGRNPSDGNGVNEYARRYTSAGASLGSVFYVNTPNLTERTGVPAVGVNATGQVIVAWTGPDAGGTNRTEVFARLFSNLADVTEGGITPVGSGGPGGGGGSPPPPPPPPPPPGGGGGSIGGGAGFAPDGRVAPISPQPPVIAKPIVGTAWDGDDELIGLFGTSVS